MRKNLTILAIAMFGLIAFGSCTKSSSGSSNTMTATMGSTAFSADNCIFGISSGSLSILAFNGSGVSPVYPYISIGILNYTAGQTGTYTISDTSINVIAVIDSSTTVGAEAVYGTITIKSSSASAISGTFSFTTMDSTKVSNGNFNAKFD